MNNFIKFSTDIIAANSSKRELTGVIVPFGQVGHTNMGDVVFQQGSLKIGEGIKLFTEHDMTRPIGKLARYEEDDKGIVGTFKIARTNAGDDALTKTAVNMLWQLTPQETTLDLFQHHNQLT
jgi:phage head maturation protease